jgi:hypothetical protein
MKHTCRIASQWDKSGWRPMGRRGLGTPTRWRQFPAWSCSKSRDSLVPYPAARITASIFFCQIWSFYEYSLGRVGSIRNWRRCHLFFWIRDATLLPALLSIEPSTDETKMYSSALKTKMYRVYDTNVRFCCLTVSNIVVYTFLHLRLKM